MGQNAYKMPPIPSKDIRFGQIWTQKTSNHAFFEIKDVFLNCFDIVVKKGVCGDRKVVFAKCDGLTSSEKIIEGITKPMLHFSGDLPKKDVFLRAENR